MQRSEEISLLEELLGLKKQNQLFLDDSPTTNSVHDYTDTRLFDAEQKQIFNHLPLVIAHASELDGQNSFIRRTVRQKPLLLTRGDDNQIRAFLNVCRHRGTRLVSDENGCKHKHSCPYHAWTWNSRGEFVNGPHFDTGFPGMDKNELSLTAVPIAERHGFIWLLPENGLQNIEQTLGEFDQVLDWAGTELLVLHQSELQVRHCNWKILIEGGIEAYHFRIAHRNTIAPLFSDNLSSYQCIGPHMRSVLARSSITELAQQPREQWHIRDYANILLNVFPSCALLVQSDHVSWVQISPLAVDRSEVRIMTLKPTDTEQTEDYWNRNHELTVTTLNEDFDIGESIQAGLLSGANENLTFGRFEGALNRFNQNVRSYLNPPRG